MADNNDLFQFDDFSGVENSFDNTSDSNGITTDDEPASSGATDDSATFPDSPDSDNIISDSIPGRMTTALYSISTGTSTSAGDRACILENLATEAMLKTAFMYS